ncbi:MAG TPA: hypothetical protein VGZ26_02530, partial [Pirellulales bacterium]|nr:hypothetical protein [Pirellulales bacterium]
QPRMRPSKQEEFDKKLIRRWRRFTQMRSRQRNRFHLRKSAPSADSSFLVGSCFVPDRNE